jgi:uncharacterized OsmC-like protein
VGPAGAREYEAKARSTDVFGRVLVSCRDNHLVIDGPVQNGCPGEAVTPGEAFLAGVASCGVELLQVIARERGITLGPLAAEVRGTIDRDRPVRDDVTVFNEVRLRFELRGIGDEDAAVLVESFKAR